jgi:predicted nuclease of restriction endonuclease-like (RecB) superfamily
MKEMSILPFGESEYNELLRQAVAVIDQARTSVAIQANNTISNAYWHLGHLLNERKLETKHGSGVVKRLSADLKQRFPDLGVSPRNLWDMKRFYLRYVDVDPKLRQAVAVLPWGHNLLILNKNLPDEQALFYATEVLTKGWSREMLLHAIKGNYYANLLATPKSNNFSQTLPAPVADYANEVFRSRYNLGFLGVTEPMKELKLERRLVNKITRFILELGKGFTFIGNQHILPFNGKEYKVDMLFFHRGLHRMIAIDLKVGEFQPEYVGKMNYYLTLLDRMEKAPDEEPSIGLILCAEKDHLDVEVALQDIGKPIGVAEYQYLLPKEEILQIVSAEMNKADKEAK